jgi:hypothetical protein
MANNFKLVGTNYVAKSPAGHDSNNGTTPDTPKASDLVVPTSGILIIGAGQYEASSVGTNVGTQLRGDGKVIISRSDISGTTLISGGNIVSIRDIEFVRCSFSNVNNVTGGTNTKTLSSCILKSCVGLTTNNNVGYRSLSGCVIINSTIGNSSSSVLGGYFIISSIVINSLVRVLGNNTSNKVIRDSYLDPSSIFQYDGSPVDFRRNNIQGVIRLEVTGGNWKDYAIQDQLTGTPQDNGYDVGVEWLTQAQLTADGYIGTISGWNTAVGTCINRDPKFNNPSVGDYSLQADSPHIGRGLSGSNIGVTQIAFSVINTDDGIGDTQVIPSAEIDTTVPLSYQLESEENEGFVDYIFKVGSDTTVLGIIRPLAELNFNSDEAGGTSQNNNVPDSEPLSADYPRKLTTTSAAPDTVTLVVAGNDAVVGEWVRVNGQDREITDVVGDDITVASAFAASIGSGVTFQIGTESELGALRPNRLTYLIRTSTSTSKPVVAADWDNGIDPIYDAEGLFLTQEWNKAPGYIIDNLDGNKVYGAGDSDAPTDISVSDMEAIWVQIRVYLRNDYES